MPVNEAIGSHLEEILHFGGIRLRVTGAGNLQLRLLSLDNTTINSLAPITMSSITNREPTRLANFITQRGALTIFTTELNEQFNINRVILFLKPIWTQYPG